MHIFDPVTPNWHFSPMISNWNLRNITQSRIVAMFLSSAAWDHFVITVSRTTHEVLNELIEVCLTYFLSVWNCWCYCPVASIRFEYWHLTQEVQHIGRPNHSCQIQTPVDWRPSYAALSHCVWCLKHALGSGVTARVNYYCWYAIPPHYPGELGVMYTVALCYGTVTRVEW